MNKGVPVTGSVAVDAYRVIERAVQEGIAWGWQHAHKYASNPGELDIKESIERDVMGELCEVLRFGGE